MAEEVAALVPLGAQMDKAVAWKWFYLLKLMPEPHAQDIREFRQAALRHIVNILCP